MNLFGLSPREQVLARIAPITDKTGTDRRMRAAVLHARRKGPGAVAFGQQQAFDRAVAALVRDIPVSAEISEWFRNEKLIPQKKRGWKKTLLNPVVLSIALALVVIAGVVVFVILERMNEFPGSSTARKMLTVAASMRGVQVDPIATEAGSLSDFFFMKYQLEHYDVPPEFAGRRTAGCRVFDDDEGHRIAQISLEEKRVQFFLFPAERDPKNARALEFSGWRYVENEGWTGAVQVRNGVCFMVALRGQRQDLAAYLAKENAAAGTDGSLR
ncbi:MAG TPA: hypothetical protein VK474_01645 [Chthoniobacterales bacterium]|nr:hypothetical protein [Chthoniobacterales bacterium]